MIIHHEPTRWWAYCHRCGEAGIRDKPVESLADRLLRLKTQRATDEAMRHCITLPSPTNFDIDSWPSAARVWLYKAGLGKHDIAKLGAYWHEPSGRVVLPVFEARRVVYWQARAVDGREPKYINPEVDRQHLVARFGRGDPLVIVEDVLSAYRVGEFTECWSLLGTKLTDSVAEEIIRRGDKVLVWLDPDWSRPEGKRPGVIAGKRIEKQLCSMGVDARRVTSKADPKLLSRREIKWKIC